MDLMLEVVFGIIVVLIIIFFLTILLPAISIAIFNKNLKEKEEYVFPKELIEQDYPNNKFFEDNKKEFEKKKKEVASQKLP